MKHDGAGLQMGSEMQRRHVEKLGGGGGGDIGEDATAQEDREEGSSGNDGRDSFRDRVNPIRP